VNREWRFVNQFQPQTLVIATILCYFNAVSGILFGALSASGYAALVVVGLGAGGFGIANDKRWGYAMAVGGSILQVLLVAVVYNGGVFENGSVIGLLFDVALVALLLHPMSRDYQRIWFK
jgi:L-asparaginase/Glu-tRNA(Gln) amidotransferase subunit D